MNPQTTLPLKTTRVKCQERPSDQRRRASSWEKTCRARAGSTDVENREAESDGPCQERETARMAKVYGMKCEAMVEVSRRGIKSAREDL